MQARPPAGRLTGGRGAAGDCLQNNLVARDSLRRLSASPSSCRKTEGGGRGAACWVTAEGDCLQKNLVATVATE